MATAPDADPETSDPPATSAPRADVRTAVVRFFNPRENQCEVHFVVNGKQLTLLPGARMELPAEQELSVTFDRGAQFGVWEGTAHMGREYRFCVDAQGWRLESPAQQ